MNKIIETELKYSRCFSQETEKENYITFEDPLIPDMYSHNFTYLKGPLTEAVFVNALHEIVKHAEKKPFLNLLSDWPMDAYEKHFQPFQYEKRLYEYYEIDATKIMDIRIREDCTYKPLSAELLEQALAFDLIANKEDSGETFVTDRFNRRSRVYLENQGVTNYLFYHNDEIIAHCDLFFNETHVKLEDLNVRPDMQRKGFGKTILRKMFELAQERGVDKLYLIAHAEESAREMYQKSGMIKVGEKTEVFIDFQR